MNIQATPLRRNAIKRTHLRVAILTGRERHFWIHPELFRRCMDMTNWVLQTGSRLEMTCVNGYTPVDAARNKAVEELLKSRAEWLLQIDNDVVPPPNILSVLDDIQDRKIVGLPCAMEPAHIVTPSGLRHVPGYVMWNLGDSKEHRSVHENLPPPCWIEVNVLGSGCLLVHRDVFAAMDRPWFQCSVYDGTYAMEDTSFCQKARQKGFRVWTHSGFACKHFKTVDLRDYMSDRRTLSIDFGKEPNSQT